MNAGQRGHRTWALSALGEQAVSGGPVTRSGLMAHCARCGQRVLLLNRPGLTWCNPDGTPHFARGERTYDTMEAEKGPRAGSSRPGTMPSPDQTGAEMPHPTRVDGAT